jgi:hypothetical protein
MNVTVAILSPLGASRKQRPCCLKVLRLRKDESTVSVIVNFVRTLSLLLVYVRVDAAINLCGYSKNKDVGCFN